MVAPIKTFENRVRDIIEERDRGRWPLTRALLGMVARVYGLVVGVRAWLYDRGVLNRRQLPCKVIAIGNLTAGGTGKTPMAIHVAELLRRLGYTVAVISRGYKGKAERTAAIVSDGRQILLAAHVAGDEPVMMAQRLEGVPVIVGGDRVAAGRLATSTFHPDVIVCDDAFQHLRLTRDIDLVLLDCARPFGNGRLLPRGMLREPLAALRRADALIMTRCDHAAGGGMDPSHGLAEGKPIFAARHDPYVCRTLFGRQSILQQGRQASEPAGMALIKGRKVYSFSAIARNQDFRDGVQKAGATLVGYTEFGDHHFFTGQEIADICVAADRGGAQILVTTEKDYVRIAGRVAWPLDLVVIGIRIVIMDGPLNFENFIKDRL